MVTAIAKAHRQKTGPAEVDTSTLDKLTFLYHYLMNFRSRFSRELKTKVRRKWITEAQHEAGNKQISDVSASLKEAKQTMDRLRIVMVSQAQYAIDRHQRWQHPWEVKEQKDRASLEQKQPLQEHREEDDGDEEQIITSSQGQSSEAQDFRPIKQIRQDEIFISK